MNFYVCTPMGTYLSFSLFHLEYCSLCKMFLLWNTLCKCATVTKLIHFDFSNHDVDLGFNFIDWII